MAIIDSHAHLHLREGFTSSLVAIMDRLGIDKTVVVAGGTVSPDTLSKHYCEGGGVDADVDNRAVLKECLTTRGRLLPFYYANPYRGTEEYESIGSRFFGLKLAPIVHGVPFSDPRISAFLDVARFFSHPIYLHCLPRAGFGVSDLVVLAEKFPDLYFIMGHGGVGHGDFTGINLIEPVKNIFFEISGSFTAATRVACKKLGADRVLFGSEYPLQDHRVELAKIECLELNQEDYEKITSKNIRQLLHMDN